MPKNGTPRRILIADDHDAIRQGVRAFIEQRKDWRVVAEAATGDRALQLAREHLPEVAVLDYSLPVLNGLDVMRAMKREHPSIEVLFYTMHDREDLIAEALAAGARGYVLKSDPREELVAGIEAALLRRPYLSSAVPSDLVERVRGAGRRGRATLTPRERAVVQLIAEGRINRQIGEALSISVKTVETHRAAAMRKLGVGSAAELVRYAVRNNIVEA